MKHRHFTIAAATLLGLAIADMAFGFMGITANVRVAILLLAVVVFLIPHFDGVLGSISLIRMSANNDGGKLEIKRQVDRTNRAADKAAQDLEREFKLSPRAASPPTRPAASSQRCQEWREMIRVSDLILRRLSDRLDEDPDMVGDLPLVVAIGIAEKRGQITSRQANALRGFDHARCALIETCRLLKADTPVSVVDRVWRLVEAGDQLLAFL